jgi:acetyl-CoA synthetase (ADP-forming)
MMRENDPAAGPISGLVAEPDAAGILARYGIPYPDHGLARSAAQAVELAERIGFPAVLKVVSPQASHKTDVGGVVLNVGSADEVRTQYDLLLDRVRVAVPGIDIQGVLVARQAGPGLEAIVGGIVDPVFGPVVMFGLGGIFAEVIADVSFGLAPIEETDAADMIEEIKGHALLLGRRGMPPRDLGAVKRLLVSVSRLMADRPEIRELDLNPVMLYPEGLLALDARIVLRS